MNKTKILTISIVLVVLVVGVVLWLGTGGVKKAVPPVLEVKDDEKAVRQVVNEQEQESKEFVFICPSGDEIRLNYGEGADEKVYLSIQDKNYTLYKMRSRLGLSHYASRDEKVVFWEYQGKARVEINGETLFENCVLEEDFDDEKAVRQVVNDFGRELKNVYLTAPEEEVRKAMEEHYGDLVVYETIKGWFKNPQEAPGRLTSSPWPERIEIDSVSKETEGKYLVKGRIVEITSVEALEGGMAGERKIDISLAKFDDSWLITDVSFIQSSSVVLENISPLFGPLGTEVIIYGSGFTSTNNDIAFTHPEIDFQGRNTAYLNNISSPDGTTLLFNIPDNEKVLLGACALSQLKQNEVCDDIGILLPKGTVQIAVVNKNGVSNNVTFTVSTSFSYDKIKSNINAFMESQVSQNALGKENYHCSNLLYGYDEKYAYAWVLCSGFITKSNGELELGTGFSIPVRFEYKQPDFQIVAYEHPEDGSFYDTTLRQLFPKKFYDLSHPSNDELSELEKEVWDKARQADCLKRGGYCAKECNENDGLVYLKGCPSGQVCCMPKESYIGCRDLCGDGICQEVVCLAIGCPCAETVKSCPQDCK